MAIRVIQVTGGKLPERLKKGSYTFSLLTFGVHAHLTSGASIHHENTQRALKVILWGIQHPLCCTAIHIVGHFSCGKHTCITTFACLTGSGPGALSLQSCVAVYATCYF